MKIDQVLNFQIKMFVMLMNLTDRFFNKKVSQSNGELDIQAIDTITSIKDESI